MLHGIFRVAFGPYSCFAERVFTCEVQQMSPSRLFAFRLLLMRPPRTLAMLQDDVWPTCDVEAADPSCFVGTGGLYTCAGCCETRQAGTGGSQRCWGGGYTYERCCPPCPLERDDSCFDGTTLTCSNCCDRRLGARGNVTCWESDMPGRAREPPRNFERCCLGRAPICEAEVNLGGGRRLALRTSQDSQDDFVLKWLNCPVNGFYLDIGAYDGEHLSNTHAMDVDLGWRGACVDAVLRKEKFSMRSCNLLDAAVHSESGRQMYFQRFDTHHSGAYGGLQLEGPDAPVAGHLPHRAAELMQGVTDATVEGGGKGFDKVLGGFEWVPMVTRTLADIIVALEAGGMSVPRVLDFVSVDVEGAVYHAVAGFPFQTHCVRLWSLELGHPLTSFGDRAELIRVTQLMQANGYLMVEKLKLDYVFAHGQDCQEMSASGADDG